jgi:GTP 3',8-cyclase
MGAPAREPLRDGHGRLIGDLRLSVVDRCNFRCQYCMPADGLPWLDRSEILTFEAPGFRRPPRSMSQIGG